MNPRALALGPALTLILQAGVASADILPDGQRPLGIQVTFGAPADAHLVAYPIDCMGLDVKLNPHLRYRQDYDVIEPGKARAPYKFCGSKTKLWALDTAAFTKGTGEKVPDWIRGPWKLEQIDRIGVDERLSFFETNAHVHPTGYSMPEAAVVPLDSPLQSVTESVSFGGIPAKAQKISLVYTYKDGTTEAHSYRPGLRPQPRRAEARNWMQNLVLEEGAPSSAASVTTAAPGPFKAAKAAPLASRAACGGCTVRPPSPAGGRSSNRRILLVLALVAALAGGLVLRSESV